MPDQIKVLSLLQVLGHPRDSKRIAILQDENFDVEVLAFERDYHTGRMPNCKIQSLGRIQNRAYLKRFFKILFAMPKLRSAMKHNQVIYASGQDMALMAYIAGLGLNKPIVLEVGDIVNLQLANNFLGKVVRKIEKFFVSRYALLVVISEGFLEVYYRNWLNVKIKAQVIENKLEHSFYENYADRIEKLDNSNLPLKNRPLRIGYFGLLRDEWSWQVLERLAVLKPNSFEIVFAGYVIDPSDLPERVKHYKNMKYMGEYKSPNGLPELYNSVDMVWACYPKIGDNDWNLKWGRPNRFFESCFFNKPTFARDGAHFANDVRKYNIGKVIKNYQLDKVVEEILSIDFGQIQSWSSNLSQLPREVYLYSNENKLLADNIKSLIK